MFSNSRRVSPELTVLVVDDDPCMLHYVRALLESDCYKVETASSGTAALDQLRAGVSPDVVLLDVNMPEMDGLQTLRQLLQFRPALKVIMCSGIADPRKALTAFLMGAQDFLTKPFRHLYLSAALERCVHTRKDNKTVPWQVVQEMWEVSP